jgi:hypothetical protein
MDHRERQALAGMHQEKQAIHLGYAEKNTDFETSDAPRQIPPTFALPGLRG